MYNVSRVPSGLVLVCRIIMMSAFMPLFMYALTCICSFCANEKSDGMAFIEYFNIWQITSRKCTFYEIRNSVEYRQNVFAVHLTLRTWNICSQEKNIKPKGDWIEASTFIYPKENSKYIAVDQMISFSLLPMEK